MEGSLCFGSTTCDTTDLTFPVAEYDHTEGCSISGGAVYRGSRYPGLYGIYFFGDWCSGHCEALQYANGAWHSALLYDTTLSIITFAEDEAGKFWVADYNGAIYPIKEGAPVPIDLSLNQSDSLDPCPAGSRLTYTIDLRNNSSTLATGVVVTDTIPAGASFVAVSSTLVPAVARMVR